jgi:hypothetical protein
MRGGQERTGNAMNGLRRSSWVIVLAGVLLSVVSGCQSTARRTASAEPGMTAASPTLGAPAEPGGTAVAATPPESNVAWYDRHPLFSRPKHYYDSTPSNKVVKVGVATVVGVPAGVFGEIKQIVVGVPAESKY